MRISPKTLRVFNSMRATNEWPCMNDSWNKANGRPLAGEYAYLNKVRLDTFGMFSEPLKPKHLK